MTRLIDELGRMDGVRVVALCGRTVPEVLAARDDVETLATNFDRSDRTAIRRLWWEETQLVRWIRESHADIFHATWNTGIPWRCPIPSVLTVHDLIPLHDPDTHFSSRSQFAAYRHALRSSVARAVRTITVSDHVRRDLSNTLGLVGNRVIPVHNGVDMPLHRVDDSGSDQPPFVLHAGGPLPRKNVAAVFRAMDEYCSRHCESLEVRVTFLEEDLCHEARRVFRQMRQSKQVRFIGHVDDRVLSEQYTAARALLVLSRDEGFGLPVLEAMAHGCPVIAASNASLPEIVGNAGVLVDPENERSVADELHRVIADPAWRDRLVRLGRTRAKRFGWDVCAQRVREVYDIALAAASFSQQRQSRIRWGPSRSSQARPTVPS
ncbi:MAG: glycosyltransferase family 4 protein [Planctomycetes bacterium]|nr:glycosyltransferase family 4 protein [Planctomycetota bacterium]